MDALPRKNLWSRAWDTFVDANPIFARELFANARSRAYAGAIVMAPLLLGGLVVLMRINVGREIEPFAGRALFTVYYLGLAMVLGTAGAVLGSTVIAQEREAGALEALKLSSLSPRAIVLGKFVAVLFAEASVVLCTLPFCALVLSMGAVSLVDALVAMGIAVTCGVMTAGVGIAVSSQVTHTRRSLLLSLVGSSVLGIGVTVWTCVGTELSLSYEGTLGIVRAYGAEPWSGKYLALLYVIPAFGVTAVLWLCYAVALSGLTDLSDDRGLSLKRWTVGTLVMGAVALAICAIGAGERPRSFAAWASMIATASMAVALLFAFVGAPASPTRRMHAHPPSRLVRILYPGCLAPSVLFTIVTCGAALLLIPALAGAPSNLRLDALWMVLFLAVLGGLMGSVASRGGARRARIAGGLSLMGFMVLVVLLRDDSTGPTWADGLCPLWVVGRHEAAALVTRSLVGWAVASVASVAMMLLAARAPARRMSR